jgi:hypothetical protein
VNLEARKSHIAGIDAWIVIFSIAVLAINLAVRGWFNVHTAMSRDEPYTLYFAQLPLRQFIPIVLDSNNPPTFEILLHFWSQLFGNGERAVRWLPTIIISLGSIPFALLGKRIGGFPAMFFSSLLFLGSGALMNFSHLDRAYCLLISGAIFQIYFLIKLAESPSRMPALGWIVATTLMCYAHYFGWFMLALTWFLLFATPLFKASMIRRMLSATIATLLLIAPIIILVIRQLSAAATENALELTTPNVHRVAKLVSEFLNTEYTLLLTSLVCCVLGIVLLKRQQQRAGTAITLIGLLFLITHFINAETRHRIITLSLFILFASTFVACFIAIWRSELPTAEKIILYWCLLPITCFFLASTAFPIFIDRYVIFALPAVILSVVILLYRLSPKPIRIALAALFLVLFFFGFRFTPTYNVDSRQAINVFKEYHSAADIGIAGPGYHDFDFTYYFNRSIFYNGANHMRDTSGVKLISESGFARYKEGLRRELLRNRIIISHDSSTLNIGNAQSVAYYDGNTKLSYADNGIYDYLFAHFGEPIERKAYDGIYTVYLFRKD